MLSFNLYFPLFTWAHKCICSLYQSQCDIFVTKNFDAVETKTLVLQSIDIGYLHVTRCIMTLKLKLKRYIYLNLGTQSISYIHTYIYIQTNFNISLYYPLNLYRKELKFQFRFFQVRSALLSLLNQSRLPGGVKPMLKYHIRYSLLMQ